MQRRVELTEAVGFLFNARRSKIQPSLTMDRQRDDMGLTDGYGKTLRNQCKQDAAVFSYLRSPSLV